MIKRYYVSPSDDGDVRTWDVIRRTALIKNSNGNVISQQLKTRREAQALANELNNLDINGF